VSTGSADSEGLLQDMSNGETAITSQTTVALRILIEIMSCQKYAFATFAAGFQEGEFVVILKKWPGCDKVKNAGNITAITSLFFLRRLDCQRYIVTG